MRASARPSGGLERLQARMKRRTSPETKRRAAEAVSAVLVVRARGSWASHVKNGVAANFVRTEVSHDEVRLVDVAYRRFVKGLAHQDRIPDQWRLEMLRATAKVYREVR